MKAKSLLLTALQRINVSVVTSRGRVLDDMSSWINGNSEPDGSAGCNRYGGTNPLA